MNGPEYHEVEKPFLDQLAGSGWTVIEGHPDDPSVTGRSSFAEVVQQNVLRECLANINRRDGAPWLDDERLSQAVNALTRIPAASLMEANEVATALLLDGTTVEGLPDWDGGRDRVVHYIDWTTLSNNRFTAIRQYKVKCPPGHDGARGHIIADVALLVNGIPVCIVECKARDLPEGLSEAVNQLRRYSNQRKVQGEVEDNEGAPALFHTNQLLVATNFREAALGTIGARFEHFLPWKTVEPRAEVDVAADLGVDILSPQQRLVAGVLAPERLLDILRHYVLFMTMNGRRIKVACRYQQYRAVSRAVLRLKTGDTRLEDGEHDRRGGIIWHTQGSGKSLSMVFLVRKMRSDRDLRRFKVVVVTDRKDLQDQLSGTAALTGDVVEKARNVHRLKALLKRPGPGLAFATIQKYRNPDLEEVGLGEMEPSLKVHEPFEELNDSPDMLVMIDEAHRTQAGDLHANLLRALPNCARIGFTGTPIIMGRKKHTHEIFGDYIDRYTIREAEEDGATVPVLYEGRTVDGAVREGGDLDDLFEDMFADKTAEELEAIRKKYATKGHIMEAPELIRDKAADMLRHYVLTMLPRGFKAQVVAYTRRAAVRYQKALGEARDALLAAASDLSDADKALGPEDILRRPAKEQAVLMAWKQRDLLGRLEFAAVISAGTNDEDALAKWADRALIDDNITRFKKPLVDKDPEKADPLAFLIVKSMLLTGFDAPIEGVMYLDRPIREAELLQAVARVNRTGFGKARGFVVDYYGVANHLALALAAYSAEDIEGALRSLKDELPLLRDRHLRAVDVLRSRGIESLNEVEDALLMLADERVRAEFVVKLKQFAQVLDEVLPRPEGLEYVGDAKRLAYIHARARQRYKDLPELGKDIGAKVRGLIDEHVTSLGVNPRIPPIQLSDEGFRLHVSRQPNDRAKASEMKHAIRAHIRRHMDEDPVKYAGLSERLKEILHKLDGQWKELLEALDGIIREAESDAAPEGEPGSDLPSYCLPFLRLLREIKLGADGGEPDAATAVALEEATAEIVEIIVSEVRIPNFWKPSHIPDQQRLRKRLFEDLLNRRILPPAKLEATVDKLVELARHNETKLPT